MSESVLRPDLPDFENPPVTEVLLSIQFTPIPGLRSHVLGLLWAEFRGEYPTVLEQPPLFPVFETFGGNSVQPPLNFGMMVASVPAPRLWFLSADGNSVLQIQQDRIIHNWRKQALSDVYPRYEALRSKFEAEIDLIQRFLAKEGLPPLQPNQCESTYINVISPSGDNDPHLSLASVTPLWAGKFSDRPAIAFENITIQAKSLLNGKDGPIGRVYVNFTPVILSSDARHAIQLEITARGRPTDATIPSALDFLDTERAAIVQTFKSVTSEDLHKVWGMKHAI